MYAEVNNRGRVYQYPTLEVVIDGIPTEEWVKESQELLTNSYGLAPTRISWSERDYYDKFLFFKIKKKQVVLRLEFENSYYKSVKRIKKFVSRKLGFELNDLKDFSFEMFVLNLRNAADKIV